MNTKNEKASLMVLKAIMELYINNGSNKIVELRSTVEGQKTRFFLSYYYCGIIRSASLDVPGPEHCGVFKRLFKDCFQGEVIPGKNLPMGKLLKEVRIFLEKAKFGEFNKIKYIFLMYKNLKELSVLSEENFDIQKVSVSSTDESNVYLKYTKLDGSSVYVTADPDIDKTLAEKILANLKKEVQEQNLDCQLYLDSKIEFYENFLIENGFMEFSKDYQILAEFYDEATAREMEKAADFVSAADSASTVEISAAAASKEDSIAVASEEDSTAVASEEDSAAAANNPSEK